jgi:hypothetical protein
MQAQHLELEIGVVGNSHELCVTWASQDGMVGFVESDHLKGEDLCPKVGWIPKGDEQVDLPKWFGLLP